MPDYRAYEGRCAVHFPSLKLPISQEEALEKLYNKGFSRVEIDMVSKARELVGRSQYKRGADLNEAPNFLDCSSLTRYVYGQRGIWLPRRSIQQSEIGQTVSSEEISEGDLVFTGGAISYYRDNPSQGIGHVGIATAERTVIHAANKEEGITETPLDEFLTWKFRKATRIIPKGDEIITLQIPNTRLVESSDDIRWIILQSL